jgi:hypothetical protein
MQLITLCLAFALGLAACGGSSKPDPSQQQQPPPPPPQQGACIKTGCSGTECTEPGKDMMTTCEFKAEYGCYQQATCERQANGACGWTQTAELTACLANPPPM